MTEIGVLIIDGNHDTYVAAIGIPYILERTIPKESAHWQKVVSLEQAFLQFGVSTIEELLDYTP